MKVILTAEEKVEVEKLMRILGIDLNSLMYDEDEMSVYVIPAVMVNALKAYQNWITGFTTNPIKSSFASQKIAHYKQVFAKYFTRGFYKKTKKTV